MTWFLVLVIPFLIILAVLTVVDVVRNVNGGWVMAVWVAFVVLVPVIGSLVYWLTRRRKRGDAEQAYLAQADLRRERERLPIDRSGY